MKVPSDEAKVRRVKSRRRGLGVDDLVAEGEQDVVIALGQRLLLCHGMPRKSCPAWSSIRSRSAAGASSIGSLWPPGRTGRPVPPWRQIVQAVEGGHAPAVVPAQAAHDPARIDDRAGRLQILAAKRDLASPCLDADLGIVRLAALQCILILSRMVSPSYYPR